MTKGTTETDRGIDQEIGHGIDQGIDHGIDRETDLGHEKKNIKEGKLEKKVNYLNFFLVKL